MRGKGRNKIRFRGEPFFDSDDETTIYGSSMGSTCYAGDHMPRGSPVAAFSSSRDEVSLSSKDVHLQPRNETQRAYIQVLDGVNPTIVVATGAAGTGKTMIACTMAMKKLLFTREVSKLVITRPMVNVDDEEGIGFLPGSLEEKCQPWLAPLTDVFYKYVPPQKFQSLLARQTIEICPLDMMRGRSFENTFIIVDEAQNCSPTQMLMLLTRIGQGSKLVITGDPMQHDRASTVNGLADFIGRITYAQEHHPARASDIALVHFTEECIVRHPIIKNILRMYNVTYPDARVGAARPIGRLAEVTSPGEVEAAEEGQDEVATEPKQEKGEWDIREE